MWDKKLSGAEQALEVHSGGDVFPVFFSSFLNDVVHGEDPHHGNKLDGQNGQIAKRLSDVPAIGAVGDTEQEGPVDSHKGDQVCHDRTCFTVFEVLFFVELDEGEVVLIRLLGLE